MKSSDECLRILECSIGEVNGQRGRDHEVCGERKSSVEIWMQMMAVGSEILQTHLGDFDSLDVFAAHPLRAGRFKVIVNGLPLDCLFLPGGSPDLWVFFSGARQAQHGSRPLLQRWRWKDMFPGHALYVADPTFVGAPESLVIGWYFGNAKTDGATAIAALVDHTARRLDVKSSRVFLYGSSAGGYGALSVGSRLPQSTAVAINPQTNILEYHRGHVERFLRAVGVPLAKTTSPRFADRLSIFGRIDKGRSSKYLIVQNVQDKFHFDQHYAPLCKAFGVPVEGGQAAASHIQSMLYDSANGHGAEPLEVVHEILAIVEGKWASSSGAITPLPTAWKTPSAATVKPKVAGSKARVLPFSGAPTGEPDLLAYRTSQFVRCHNLIVTRYFLKLFAPAGSPAMSNREVQTWFENRERLFNQYTLPSIVGQTAWSKTWLVFVEQGHSALLPHSLQRPNKPPFVEVVEIDSSQVRFEEFSHHIASRIDIELQRMAGEGIADPVVVTSRIDNDDALACDFLACANRVALGQREAGVEQALISFPHGLQLREGVSLGTYLSNNNHFLCSFHSAMSTTDSHLHALAFNHTTLFTQPTPTLLINTDLPMWLETVHGDNVHNRYRSGMGPEDLGQLERRFSCRLPLDRHPELTSASNPDIGFERMLVVQASCQAMKPESFLRAYSQILATTAVSSMLEIGIHQGGSLKFWRVLYGVNLRLYGLDIKPECSQFAPEPANEVFIGSQVDHILLDAIAKRCGNFDLVIDDGSHRNDHMWNTFNHLFNTLAPGGAYVIEDAFTSYWDRYGGGLAHPDSLIERSKTKIDEIFARFLGKRYEKYHNERLPAARQIPSISSSIESIEFHRCGLVVFRKTAHSVDEGGM
jgi:poly(3-hydroxybutyrate) depolymerase